MMKLLKKGKILLLSVAVCQLFNTSCTKRIHTESPRQETPGQAENLKLKDLKYGDAGKEKESHIQPFSESSYHNIDSHGENTKLKSFLKTGTEKEIEIPYARPDTIIKIAQRYLGVPHCMGGTSMKCLDCSGLLVAVFARLGVSVPHNSEDLARYGKIIPTKDQLVAGDLVFFIRSYKTQHFITHSGIYMGNNEFIHASSSDGVTITSLNDSWWKDRFIFGTRVFK
jgi:murein DD-endopeptidase / murein LD-carboxypeptidase